MSSLGRIDPNDDLSKFLQDQPQILPLIDMLIQQRLKGHQGGAPLSNSVKQSPSAQPRDSLSITGIIGEKRGTQLVSGYSSSKLLSEELEKRLKLLSSAQNTQPDNSRGSSPKEPMGSAFQSV